MLFVRPETVMLKDLAQESIEYAGKTFYKTAQFQLDELPMAEEQCRATWNDGRCSILVELEETLLLFCEGIESQLASTVSSTSEKSAYNTSLVPPVPPAYEPIAGVMPEPAHLTPISEDRREPEQDYVEIMYRGSVLRKPVDPQRSANTNVRTRHSYRGISY